jgi:ABC-type ATPase with predicted acetyltransferase domain
LGYILGDFLQFIGRFLLTKASGHPVWNPRLTKNGRKMSVLCERDSAISRDHKLCRRKKCDNFFLEWSTRFAQTQKLLPTKLTQMNAGQNASDDTSGNKNENKKG